MDLEPKTEREIMVGMSVKMEEMSGAITRLALAIEKLETNRISALEARIFKLEKFMNEWGGVVKVASLGAFILSAYAAIKK